jgi:outer membrane protein assembly complex protein YaeT
MIATVKIAVLLLFLLLILPIRMPLANDIPDKFELVGVAFKGVESVSQKELAKALAARIPPFWKFWQPAPTLEREDIEDDLNRIRQFYRNDGYFRAEAEVSVMLVDPSPKRPPAKEEAPGPSAHDPGGDDKAPTPKIPRIKVTFSVKEGSPVVVASIDIDISPPAEEPLPQELKAKLPLVPGRVFQTAKYEEAKKIIARFFGNRGYPFAEVTGQAVIDPTVDQAKLSFRIIPGPLSTFGAITITQEGTEVSETVIRRALVINEGERYNADKVDISRRNLIQLDVFRTALIQTEGPPESNGGPVAMHVQLKSKERRSVRLGAGYGTEDKLRFQAALTYRNLAGQGGRLSLSGRISDILRNVQLTYVQPYFLDAKNTLTTRAGTELEEPPAYKNNKIFADAALRRKLTRNWHMQMSYGLSFNKEESVAASSPVDIEELPYLDQTTRISSAGLEIARDTRDNLLNPTTGSYLGAKIDLAPKIIGSELTYYQQAIEAKVYQQVFKHIVLAGRVQLQTIQGMQDTSYIPAFKRLYLGGSDTVRGYDFQKLPPLNRNGDPIGGQTGLNASVEARFPLYKELSGVAFLDAGLLDVEPFQLDFADTRYTCGVGLRYNTVIGPIRVDFGYKLNPQTGKDIGDIGQPDKIVDGRWRLYLNIGQAF